MANRRRRANRAAMFNTLIAQGYDPGAAGAIANTPNWGKANRRFQAAANNAPVAAPQAAAPVTPQQPALIKPPSQVNATISSIGSGVGRSKKKIDKRRVSDLRMRRGKKSSVARGLGSATGTGMNTGLLT